MLTAYFDDSGTHGGSQVVVMGGVIGSEKHWLPFERAWRTLLADPLPQAGKHSLRRFHMAPCVLREGEFARYTESESDAVIHRFRQIILDSDLLGFSCAVSLKAWDAAIGTRSIRGLRDPTIFCMAQAISWSAKIARDYSPDRQAALVFDDMPERRDINEKLFAAYHRIHNEIASREEVASITFASSELFLPLQAADMIAWESYNYIQDWLRDPATPVRAHLARLAESGRFIAYGAGSRAINEIKTWLDGIQDVS